jgi:hypothetical protein
MLYCSQCFCHSNILLRQQFCSWHRSKNLSVVKPLPVPNIGSIISHTTRCPKFFSGAFPGSFPV